MVARLIFLFLLSPLFLFSGEFTAVVSRNQVNLGESITLTLTLKDASAKVAPSLVPMLKSFHLNSQQQFSNTTINNGKMSTSIIWKFVLIPQSEGETVIPSISVDTSSGTLSSDPITIRVVKGQAPNEEQPLAEQTTLTTHVSKENPYKNEPIFFTVRLASKQTLVNIQMDKLIVEDAIVEMDGNPKVSENIVDGARLGVIEFNYLITPLKAGNIKIPSVVVQGAMPLKRKSSGRSLFDDDFDPFSLMQGFDQLKPFAMPTEQIVLDVQSAVADINPWLPAKSLMIEEIWDSSQKLQEGEFFTRGFKIRAEGINSSQLSSLGDLQASDKRFKIYADKPESTDETAGRQVRSTRREQYTLIPHQAGKITLPEIAVTWWNVEKNEKVVTRIAARTLDVLPMEQVAMNTRPSKVLEEKSIETVSETAQINYILYAVIGVLAILLFGAIIWAVTIQRKMTRLLNPIVEVKSVVKSAAVIKDSAYAPKSRREKLNDLNPT